MKGQSIRPDIGGIVSSYYPPRASGYGTNAGDALQGRIVFAPPCAAISARDKRTIAAKSSRRLIPYPSHYSTITSCSGAQSGSAVSSQTTAIGSIDAHAANAKGETLARKAQRGILYSPMLRAPLVGFPRHGAFCSRGGFLKRRDPRRKLALFASLSNPELG